MNIHKGIYLSSYVCLSLNWTTLKLMATAMKGLPEILSMVNFYHRFLPSAGEIIQPLYQAITGKHKQLQWTEESIAALTHTHEALANAIMLTYP